MAMSNMPAKPKPIPNRIRELRLQRRLNQWELADLTKAHWVTISKLERGQMHLTQKWMERLATALKVHPQDLLTDAPLKRTIYVEGALGTDWTIIDTETMGAEPDPGLFAAVDFEIDFGTEPPATSIWYFAAASLGPTIQIGDALRFTSIEHYDPDQLYGRLCLVRLEGKSLIGTLLRGAAPSEYDLMAPSGSIFHGLVPRSIAVLTMVIAMPRYTPEQFGEEADRVLGDWDGPVTD
jgi:DNA-binding Xre family transcriptional regulator